MSFVHILRRSCKNPLSVPLSRKNLVEDPPNVKIVIGSHGTGIFFPTFTIKNQPNVGKFWDPIMVNIPGITMDPEKRSPPRLDGNPPEASARRSDRRLSKEKEVWTPWTVRRF